MTDRVVPFHILIGPRQASGAYAVRATFGQAETTAELQLPEQIVELAAGLIGPGERPIGDVEALGHTLGRALFGATLRDLLLRAARSAAEREARLQLQLQVAVPELAALPWEWLTIGAERSWSPALRGDYALVRVGRRATPPAPLPLTGPLRVLAVAGPGETRQLEALDAALHSYVRAARIALTLLPTATPTTLRRVLAAESPHVLHLAASVGLTHRETLEVDLGMALDAYDLAELLGDAADLRLVTLAGAHGELRSVSAAPPLLGAILVGEQLPAALTLSSPMPPAESARLAAICYTRLAAGVPIDLAVTAARGALTRSGAAGWGAVQLRLVPGVTGLFEPARRRMPAPRLDVRRLAPIGGAIGVCAALILAGRAAGSLTASAERAAPQSTALVEPAQPAGLVIPFFTPPTPTPAPTPLPPTPTPLPAPSSYTVHTVAPDESLAQIAARYGSDARGIAEQNMIDLERPPRAGRALVVPLYGGADPGSPGALVDRGDPTRPRVALTFDIEIDEATLYSFLEIMGQKGVRGTFFVTGSWVSRFPDAARAIVGEGHEIANHSLTHPYFSQIGLDGAASELRETDRIVRETTGAGTRPYFRFPYGDSTPQTLAVAAREGFVAYHWSADDPAIGAWLDRAAADPASAYGGILLMHGRSTTVAMLPEIIDRLRAIGIEPTTLGETL